MTAHARLVLERRFEASPERLFEAWTDPDFAARWLFTAPHSTFHSTEMDPRVGGRWRIVDVRGGVEYAAMGEYLEVEPPARLVFTFAMPQFSPDVTIVAVEIAPDGPGARLTLTQETLAPEQIPALREGWEEMFDALNRSLGGPDPGPPD